MTVFPIAGSHTQPTVGEQIALMCMVTGGLVWLYWLARGAAYLVLGVLWLAGLVALAVVAGTTYAVEWAGGTLWRAHRRGIERVRRYEAREADSGRRGRGTVRTRDAVRGLP